MRVTRSKSSDISFMPVVTRLQALELDKVSLAHVSAPSQSPVGVVILVPNGGQVTEVSPGTSSSHSDPVLEVDLSLQGYFSPGLWPQGPLDPYCGQFYSPYGFSYPVYSGQEYGCEGIKVGLGSVPGPESYSLPCTVKPGDFVCRLFTRFCFNFP